MKKEQEKLNRIFKYLGLSNDEQVNEASFSKDFGFDAFKMGCLHFYLEHYYNIIISDAELERLDTIGDVKYLIKNKIKPELVKA